MTSKYTPPTNLDQQNLEMFDREAPEDPNPHLLLAKTGSPDAAHSRQLRLPLC